MSLGLPRSWRDSGRAYWFWTRTGFITLWRSKNKKKILVGRNSADCAYRPKSVASDCYFFVAKFGIGCL
ncbi:MAG: hypothetical protein DME22_16325 [Verrucomicrobia bacterium]|nr:MAG: hypothetical protein DME22_16325 [Verrucomicrobiota bacterium]PYK01612.1 MAG: hypothetical protein DME23_03815 [Verrucomicrobiota bacterium]